MTAPKLLTSNSLDSSGTSCWSQLKALRCHERSTPRQSEPPTTSAIAPKPAPNSPGSRRCAMTISSSLACQLQSLLPVGRTAARSYRTADRSGFDSILLPSGFDLGIDPIAFAGGVARPISNTSRFWWRCGAARCGLHSWHANLAPLMKCSKGVSESTSSAQIFLVKRSEVRSGMGERLRS